MEILIADKPTLDLVKQDTDVIISTMQIGKPVLYGFRINKDDSNPYTRVEYLADARGKKPAKMIFDQGFDYGDWADAWFIRKLKPCVLLNSGEVSYYLNPNNYTRKIDGSLADLSGALDSTNVMVEIPLVWLYQYESGQYEYTYISDRQYNSNFKAYAHTRVDGSVADVKYLSCYKSNFTGGKLRSISGQPPTGGFNATQVNTYSSANGTGWGMRSWSDRNLINSLLLLIGKSDNSQAIFGEGNSYYQETEPNKGVLNSGTLDDKGLFYGYKDTTRQVKVFGIESWWGDLNERVNGLSCDYGVMKVKPTAPYNTDNQGYIDMGYTFATNQYGSYAVKSMMTQYGRIPLSSFGSSETYLCDSFSVNITYRTSACVGGSMAEAVPSKFGMNSLNLNGTPVSTTWDTGSGLSYETENVV